MRNFVVLAICILSTLASDATAVIVNQVYKNGFPNTFFDGPVTVTTGTFENNVVQVFTYDANPADHTGGGGFTLAISNGPNSFNVGYGDGPNAAKNGPVPGTTNTDLPNPEPLGAAIDIANGGDGTMGNRLKNGNAFRFSIWMRHDPAKPVVADPSVEPVLKFELFTEAQSIYADYDGRKPNASYGDRAWDTDNNATDALYEDQSRARFVDINNDGMNINSDPVTSIAADAPWTLLETTLIIDDTPLDGDTFGWDIAGNSVKVADIEEIRATFFTGDFRGDSAPLDEGGRFFLDNALLEGFADATAMAATPNPNPMPVAAHIGDYNDNGVVDAADYTVWRDLLGGSAVNLFNRQPGIIGPVKLADYTAWKTRLGNGGSGSLAGGQPVPEPGTIVLCFLASVGAACIRRHHR